MTAITQARVEHLPRTRTRSSQRLDIIFEVPLSNIDPGDLRFQMRLQTSTADVEACIRRHGQQVPITLWGRVPHIIIDGFRRVHALTALGHTTAMAILRDDLDEQAAHRLAFIENVKRRSWTPFERAVAIRKAVETRGIHLKQIAEELTLSERQVQRYLPSSMRA
jgi:ParB/RepB/Spo0J family partition protein